MSDKDYNKWRRDISCEYVVTTGRAFPSFNRRDRAELCRALVRMSDRDVVPSPQQAIAELVGAGLLQSAELA